MNYKAALLGIIIIAGIGAYLAFTPSSPTLPTGSVKIGAAISLSGFAADYGDMAKKAMELAAEEIAADGGTVELIFEDDETDPTKAVSAYRKLVDVDQVDAVVGSIFDFTTQPLLPLALKDNRTLVVPAQPTIKGSFEMNAATYSMMPRFEQIVSTLEPVIVNDAKATKLGILRYQSDFGKEIERVLTGIAAKNNLPPLAVEAYAEIGKGDFRTQILKLKQNKVDVLFLDALTPDVVAFKKQTAELGYSPRVISYSHFDAMQLDTGNAARYENDYWLDWQDTVSSGFAERFETKYGVKPRRGAEASYRAVYVLYQAQSNLAGKTFTLPDNQTFSFTNDHNAGEIAVTIYKVTNGVLVPVVEVND